MIIKNIGELVGIVPAGVARKCGFVLEPQGDGERELRYLDGAPLDRLVLTAEEARRKKSRAA